MDSRTRVLLQRTSLIAIAEYHNDVIASLRMYFSAALAASNERFIGYKAEELAIELAFRVEETDLRSALSVLTSLEASFRLDYDYRCRKRMKDSLSRAFRDLNKARKGRISLDDDIFENWGKQVTGASQLIGELRAAFRFRHWLAHGHYWDPKLGKRYDFDTVYSLAEAVLNNLTLLKFD